MWTNKVALTLLTGAVALSAHAQRATLSKAAQDPFASYAPPLAKTNKAPRAAMAPALAPEAAPLPKAPDLGLQYAGKMTTPAASSKCLPLSEGN